MLRRYRKTAENRLLKDERGTFSVEAVLMFPVLCWAFIAMYVFFEGLREQNINLKATYAIGDMLSRQLGEIDDDFMNGMNTTYAWLSRAYEPTQIRVTVVQFDEDDDQHKIYWSKGVNGRSDLTQDQVDSDISPYIPIMADADQAIVVESWTVYDPVMDVGLTDTQIYNFIVTAPRFAKQLKYEGIDDTLNGGGHDDGNDDDDSDDV